eukprot:363070-Chlamydomonas_euryale.AAC.4
MCACFQTAEACMRCPAEQVQGCPCKCGMRHLSAFPRRSPDSYSLAPHACMNEVLLSLLAQALRSPHKRGLRNPAAMEVARHVLESLPHKITHMLGISTLDAGSSGAASTEAEHAAGCVAEYTGIIADLAAERSLGIDGKLGSSAPEWLLPACAELCAALSGGGSQWATALASTGGAPALALAAAACQSQGPALRLSDLARAHVSKQVGGLAVCTKKHRRAWRHMQRGSQNNTNAQHASRVMVLLHTAGLEPPGCGSRAKQS